MSRSNGWATDASGVVIGHALYDGTVDVMFTRLWPTAQSAWDAYGRARATQPWDWNIVYTECKCGDSAARVPVTLSTDYGGGNEWPSEVCRACGVITGNVAPYGYD